MAETTSKPIVSHGAIARGLWCDGCMASNRMQTQVYRLYADGPRPFFIFEGCAECNTSRRL